MKKLLLASLIAVSAVAQSQLTTLVSFTAGQTATNVLVGRYAIDSITLLGSTNTVNVYCYDSSNGSTNVVLPSFTNVIQYTTNYTQHVINEGGVTNDVVFTGLISRMILSGASTNTRTKLVSAAVVSGQSRTISVKKLTLNGLTLYSTDAVIAEINYVQNP